MIRRPPRSTRTDTLFPYSTLFRSTKALSLEKNRNDRKQQAVRAGAGNDRRLNPAFREGTAYPAWVNWCRVRLAKRAARYAGLPGRKCQDAWRYGRPEERRVGKECVSTGRSGGSPYP